MNNKQLPGIHGAMANNQNRLINPKDLPQMQGAGLKKRNVSGNHRNLISLNQMLPGQINSHHTPTKGQKASHVLSTQGGPSLNQFKSLNQELTHNTKTPKEGFKRVNEGGPNAQGDDRLNLSVDIASRQHLPGGPIIQSNSTRNNSSVAYKKHTQQRDFSMRMNKMNDEKLNNSVHEFNLHKKQNSTG